MESVKRMAKTVLVVLFINVFSRALALLASILITSYYGANDLTSGYSFALSVANTFTSIIGTALTTAVIPIYMELNNKKGRKEADKFINSTLSLTLLIGAVLVIIGVLFSPLLINFSKSSDKGFSLFSMRMLLPTVLFMSMGFIFTGVLQSKDHFYAPAMVSLPSSLVSILYIVLFSSYFGLTGLVIATLGGFLFQALFLVMPLLKSGFRFALSFDYKDESIKEIFILSGPVLIGVAAYQINILTNGTIAMAYDSSKYVILSNMQNLGIQIVLTLVIATVSVIYPKLTKSAIDHDFEGFSKLLFTALSSATIMLIPLSVLFMSLSYEIVDIVYGYGKFTPDDVMIGSTIFSIYAISVIGIALKESCDRAFYALKITKVSALNGVFIMIVNIILTVAFVRLWGLNGIALSYALASLLGGFVIFFLISKKIDICMIKNFFIVLIKSLVAGAFMYLTIYLLTGFFAKMGFPTTKLYVIVRTGIEFIAGACVYVLVLLLERTRELKSFLEFLPHKKEAMKD